MNIHSCALLFMFVTGAARRRIQSRPLPKSRNFRTSSTVSTAVRNSPRWVQKQLKQFKSHQFFPANLKFRVAASLTATPDEGFFEMRTSSSKTSKYQRYGWVRFSIDGNEYRLPVYQSQALMKTEEYKGYLFLPFTDLTNGTETYPGGRYLGLNIPPHGDELIIIACNQSYNPYCAYSNLYSCPIVPNENHLDTRILAGTLAPDSHPDGVEKRNK